MSTLETIRDFVVSNFLFGDGARLKEDTSFMKSGVIDSTGILEIVTFLEKEYGIKVEDEELVPENMDTLRNLGAFADRKLAEARCLQQPAPAS